MRCPFNIHIISATTKKQKEKKIRKKVIITQERCQSSVIDSLWAIKLPWLLHKRIAKWHNLTCFLLKKKKSIHSIVLIFLQFILHVFNSIKCSTFQMFAPIYSHMLAKRHSMTVQMVPIFPKMQTNRLKGEQRSCCPVLLPSPTAQT